MNVIGKILSLKDRYDNKINEFKDSDFGQYVLTWLGPPKEYMIGKLVQVRLEAGEYGSDMVLLRHADNVLMRHENQSFYRIDSKFYPELDILFKDINKDSIDTEYTIAGGEQPKTGFIIPSEIPDGQSTPMRDIYAAVTYEIMKKFNEFNQ
jgi:hypothetical protein